MQLRRRAMRFDGLPPDYQRVDFLQAQGDRAVIDTGVRGNNDALGLDFCVNVDRFISYRGFFTNYESETANCWRLSEAASDTSLLYCLNTRTGTSSYTQITYIGKKTTVKTDKTSVTISTDTDTATGTPPTTIGTANDNTIYINSSRRYSQTRDDVIKWYYFKITDNGILIRNYVPCYRKSDNKAGFYDLVNHTFNPSIGSAEFVAGYDE